MGIDVNEMRKIDAEMHGLPLCDDLMTFYYDETGNCGKLILTDDGEFANRLMHPKNVVDKIYNVWVCDFMPHKLENLQQPVELDGYRIQPPVVCLLENKGNKAKLRVTIHEGRNRQIRRMCEIAGMRVERLQRVQEGSLHLGDLPLGKWRYLTKEEVADLMAE